MAQYTPPILTNDPVVSVIDGHRHRVAVQLAELISVQALVHRRDCRVSSVLARLGSSAFAIGSVPPGDASYHRPQMRVLSNGCDIRTHPSMCF
jgi:hypothetical protein